MDFTNIKPCKECRHYDYCMHCPIDVEFVRPRTETKAFWALIDRLTMLFVEGDGDCFVEVTADAEV